jgi:response regulator RpfG family c-di-GMP phosphodiesterase
MEGLNGMRLLLAADDREAARELHGALMASGAVPAACGTDPAEVVACVAENPPAAVLAAGADAPALRAGLDPLGLGGGPEIVTLEELTAAAEPFGPAAVRRLRAIVERRELLARRAELEAVVATQAIDRRRELDAAGAETLRRLALAAEYRDDNTHEHIQRVGELAARLARRLGRDDRQVLLVREAAPLHDLGKIAIPDTILLKPGRLTGEEFEVVKTHAVLGARVLADSGSEVLGVAEQIARSHHERWDGDGYPDGLAGEAIPLVARIVGVADVFDVLVHERPYKEAWTVEDAAREIRSGAGSQFDPGVVAAFDALGAGSWTAGLESS